MSLPVKNAPKKKAGPPASSVPSGPSLLAPFSEGATPGPSSPAPFSEGAEAVLLSERFLSFPALKKVRLPKAYRPAALDSQIRTGRTRVEARLLSKSKSAGVPCPHVFSVGADYILMEKLGGSTLNRLDKKKIPSWVWEKAGEFLARLHGARITHGDYTPANLMWDGKKEKTGARAGPQATRGADPGHSLFVIDFGLGSISPDIEDHAVDVLTMRNSISKKEAALFLSGYKAVAGEKTLKHMLRVEARARYCIRQGAVG